MTNNEQLSLRGKVTDAVLAVVAAVPASLEVENASPGLRARLVARKAARTAASISGAAALVPGPFGLLTVLPDVYGVWKVQAQMVADIAAVFGKTGSVTKEQMLFCLFKHTASQMLRDVVVRSGERYLVRRLSTQMLQSLASKIGVRMSQHALGKTLARFAPVIGAAGVGGYAYYDTQQVAKTAIELFSRDVLLQAAPDEPQQA